MLPDNWTRKDEWYNYKNLNPKVHPLLRIDESTYEGGTNGENHPIAWYHNYDGGRSFYTGLGHIGASYQDTFMQNHLFGGLYWAATGKGL